MILWFAFVLLLVIMPAGLGVWMWLDEYGSREAAVLMFVLAAAMALLLVGLATSPRDDRPCARWATSYMPMTSGNVTTMVPYEYCAEYGRWAATPEAGR